MDAFHWDENYVTGLPDVDRQHRYLVELINQFGILLSENRESYADIEKLFAELGEYSQTHFQDEEQLMQEVGLDPRHIKEHVDLHRTFLKDIGAMYKLVSPQDLDPARQLLAFLANWLAFHILGQDRKMARQIAAIQSGVTPKVAYEAAEEHKESATEPLLAALMGLFAQVSARNAELLSLNESLEAKVARRTEALSEANQQLEELSLTDVLTGLPNRRHGLRILANLWAQACANDLPLSCMMIDADYFKQVNDAYGHAAGDRVLVELACTLADSVRSDDTVCRLGGDEFLIICPSTGQQGGMVLANQVLGKVSDLRVPTGGDPWHGSISVGLASRRPGMTTYEELIQAADEAVYAAKRAGKGCIKTAG